MRRFFRQFDLLLFLAPLLLIGLSGAVIFSLSQNHAITDPYLWLKQVFFGLIGLGVAFAVSLIDYRHLRPLSFWFYAGSLVLLVFVLFTERIAGSSRWFQLGFFQIQPSELLKPVLVLLLAHLFADRIGPPPLKLLVLALILAVVPITLVLIQPDLGTAIVLFSSAIGMVMLLKLTTWQRLLLAAGLVACAGMLVLSARGVKPFDRLLKPYQRSRIETFINPKSDPLGKGYNVTQSMLAVGAGGILGRGLEQGGQSTLKFVPAPATDFIFTSFAESFGFAGCLVLLAIYVTLLARLIIVAGISQDDFGTFIAVGVFMIFLTQFYVNIGMTMGVTPVTGIPLPFLSYGGSHVLGNFLALGLLQSIVVRRKRLDFQE